MDSIRDARGHLSANAYVLRTDGHGTRSRRESRADVPSVEGEQGWTI